MAAQQHQRHQWHKQRQVETPMTAQPTSTCISFSPPGREPLHREAFKDAVENVKTMMRAYDPSVLRQAVCEMWELPQVGYESHCTFPCSAMLHKASTTSLMANNDARVPKTAANQITHHLTCAELDTVAPILLPKLSHAFLDKALALRLESIQAQQLVNALGRAERLGYNVRDVVAGDPSASGRQVPVIARRTQYQRNRLTRWVLPRHSLRPP